MPVCGQISSFMCNLILNASQVNEHFSVLVLVVLSLGKLPGINWIMSMEAASASCKCRTDNLTWLLIKIPTCHVSESDSATDAGFTVTSWYWGSKTTRVVVEFLQNVTRAARNSYSLFLTAMGSVLVQACCASPVCILNILSCLGMRVKLSRSCKSNLWAGICICWI